MRTCKKRETEVAQTENQSLKLPTGGEDGAGTSQQNGSALWMVLQVHAKDMPQFLPELHVHGIPLLGPERHKKNEVYGTYMSGSPFFLE